MTVKKEVEDGFEIIGVQMPCLITVTKPAFEPRYPTIRKKMAANRAVIPTLTSADFDIDLKQAKGSLQRSKRHLRLS